MKPVWASPGMNAVWHSPGQNLEIPPTRIVSGKEKEVNVLVPNGLFDGIGVL